MLVKIIISTYMPTERPSKEANILIFREIPEKTGGKIRLRERCVYTKGPTVTDEDVHIDPVVRS